MSTLVQEQRIEALKYRFELSDYDHAGFAKYGEAYGVAELIKREMRSKYVHHCRLVRNVDWRGFWQEYEEVNRLYMPEDPVYTGTRGGATLATTADLWTLSSPSAGQDRVLESYIGGESTVSTVLRFKIQRSTGGTTPSNQTPEKMNTRSPAANSTFATSWSSQPSLSGSVLLWHTFNTFGGTDRWVPAPGEEIYLVNAEILSARSDSGTPVVSSHVVWEEL